MRNLIIFFATIIPSILCAQNKEDLIKQIKENPTQIETIRLIQRVDVNNPNYIELEQLYKGLDKKVKKSLEAKYLIRYIDALKKTAVGKKAPGITQFDLSGAPYSLQDLKGKYVLITFWASWNRSSLQQLLEFKNVYTNFSNKNFEILGVSYDNDFQSWKKSIEENKFNWKHISDLQNMNNASALTYGIKAIPQNILVNPEGIILGRNLTAITLEQQLSELIK